MHQEDYSGKLIERGGQEIYGINLDKLAEIMQGQGNTGEIPLNDQDFDVKFKEFQSAKDEYYRLGEILFRRVLDGKASETELKIAEKDAASRSRDFSLVGGHSIVPREWYLHDRLARAMIVANENNSAYINQVRKEEGLQEIV